MSTIHKKHADWHGERPESRASGLAGHAEVSNVRGVAASDLDNYSHVVEWDRVGVRRVRETARVSREAESVGSWDDHLALLPAARARVL